MKATRVPRKKPSQSRSQATVDVILDAAARIFVETGFAAATTNAIAERAGVSVGSLYQYFPNKLALLAALKKRHVLQLKTALRATFDECSGRPLAQGVRALVETAAANFAVYGPLVRIFQDELPLHEHGERGAMEVITFQTAVRAFLGRHRAAIRVANLDDAAFFIQALGAGVMKAAVHERFDDVRSGAIVPELTAALLLYLTGHPEGLTVRATVS